MQNYNRLVNEKSPYLQAHASNPVNWYPWCDEAFETAQKKDLPIFLSIGYSACHWCHVMEEESFKDEETANILNENFVSIKVDREELAAVDNFYMEACQSFTGSGGWPLSAFLLHDKTPFFAGTYFPKESGYGRISFKSLLLNVIKAWAGNRDKLVSTGKNILKYFDGKNGDKKSEEVSFEQIYKQLETVTDKRYGGIGGAPKFPAASSLIFLLQYNRYFPTGGADKILELTLSSMERGGLHDHIGGGFFRYSTDSKWLVPHFEKMLYDNALLLYVYAAASADIDKKYEYTARKTADYMLNEMLSEEGGFYTSEDADSEGVEGKYYIFTPCEIKKCLGEAEGEKFCRDYGITEKGNFNGFNIVNRIDKDMLYGDTRNKEVFNYRVKRVKPFKDDKILTSSNGLAIAALSFAGRLLGEQGWINRAKKTADFIFENCFKDGRLMARYKEGEAAFKGTAEDYAYILWGLTELYDSTYDLLWLKRADDIAQDSIALFGGGEGGFYLSGKDDNTLPLRLKKFYDGPVPSANGIFASVFINLYAHTGNEIFKTNYKKIFDEAKSIIQYAPLGCFGVINALMKEQMLAHVMLSEGKGIDDFINKAHSSYYPFAVYTFHNNEFNSHYGNGSVNEEGNAAARICDKSGCRPPVYNVAEVADILNKSGYFIL